MRALPLALSDAMTAGTRRPAYKVYAWTASTYTQVITGTSTETPFDLTPYITEIKWTPEQLNIGVSDPQAYLHPDYGPYRDKLANGVIIRLKEGDARVDESLWVWTFTGKIKGQYGYSYSRQEKAYVGRVQAYFRGAEQSYHRRKIVTQEYTVGTDLGITVGDVLGMLGITEAERRIPPIIGRHYYHKTNQVAQLSPKETIEALLYPAFLVPFFDGEGKIGAAWKNVTKSPDVTLPDYIRVYKIEATAQTGEPINKVVIKYLDSNLTEIEGPYQKLGSASITTGFFTSKEEIMCYWSTDGKQRAKNTQMQVIKSVNGNLLPVGSESYEELDAYSGKITITISAWVPILAGASLAAYLAAAAIPDKQADQTIGFANLTVIATSPPGGGPVTGTATGPITTVSTPAGFTIPWGRITQAATLVPILLTMMSLGSAQYEIWGVPYDLVYLEKEHIAIEEGTEYWAENEVEIDNDFIGTEEVAESCAIAELHYHQSSFNARRITMDDLPGIEPGDVIQLPNEGRYYVTGLGKSIRPGAMPILEVDCFKVLGLEVLA